MAICSATAFAARSRPQASLLGRSPAGTARSTLAVPDAPTLPRARCRGPVGPQQALRARVAPGAALQDRRVRRLAATGSVLRVRSARFAARGLSAVSGPGPAARSKRVAFPRAGGASRQRAASVVASQRAEREAADRRIGLREAPTTRSGRQLVQHVDRMGTACGRQRQMHVQPCRSLLLIHMTQLKSIDGGRRSPSPLGNPKTHCPSDPSRRKWR